MTRSSGCLLLLVLLSQVVTSEIIPLQLILDASSEEVHYVEGWLEAPATIDLSNVEFLTAVQPAYNVGGDDYYDNDDRFGDDYFTDDEGGDYHVDTYSPTSSETDPPSPVPTTGTPLETQTPTVVDTDASVPPEPDGDDTTSLEPSPGPSPANSADNTPQNDDDNNGGNNTATSPPSTGTDEDGDDGDNEDATTTSESPSTAPSPLPPADDAGTPDSSTSSAPPTSVPSSEGGEEGEPSSAGSSAPTSGDDNTPAADEPDNSTGNPDEATSAAPSPATSDISATSPSPSAPVPTSSPPSSSPTDAGSRRRLQQHKQQKNKKKQQRNLDQTSSQRVTQILDIVVFMVPEDCAGDIFGTCYWASLGVGYFDDQVEGGVSYCCSQDTVARGICNEDQMGRLLVDHEIFYGEHREVEVPATVDSKFQIDNGVFNIEQSGDHVLVLGNCDDYGLDVMAIGDLEWKSVRGYLPGDMFGLMFLNAILACVYLVLVIFYGCGMRIFQDSAIPIQKYILITMILGLLELFFRAIDLFVWNERGVRSDLAIFPALIFGVLKRGISRCLLVMVAMGWGVVRDSLGRTLILITMLGIIYTGLTLFRDILFEVARESVQTLSVSTEEELLDIGLLLTPAVFVINLIFFCWIIGSLRSTTEYLRNMGQTSKLQRHLRLRCIVLTSIAISILWLAFSVADVVLSLLSPDQMWLFTCAMHLNYIFVLSGVAILWRPNSNAKDYAMQMQVPALGGGDGEEYELELSCVIPSAGDIDEGNDPDHPNGLGVHSGIKT